ncbi:hypothetical protein CU098_004122, partial [Rhizopus stolonifer]
SNNVNSFNVGAAVTTGASESSEASLITQDPTTVTSNPPTVTSNPPSTTSTSNEIPASTSPTVTTSSQSPITTTDGTAETTSTTSTTDAETTSSNTSSNTSGSTSGEARSTTSSSSEITATPSSNPYIQNSMSGTNTSRTGSIAGGVVGGVVGAVLIGGLVAFFTKRSKKQNKENDYTIDMNQNDINSAPLPPFERHAPSPPQLMYTTGPLPSEPNDYHEGYNSTGYSQGMYGQDEAFQSNGYGYYDYPQRYSKQQQDNQVYYNESYVQPISPIIGTPTESSYTSLTNKPNLKEKNKPDEVL